MTVCAWVKPDALSGWRNIVEMDGPKGWKLGFSGNNLVWTQYYIEDVVGEGTITPGQWTHVAATWNGYDLIMYINGQKDPSCDVRWVDTPFGKIPFGGPRHPAGGLNAQAWDVRSVGTVTVDAMERYILDKRPPSLGTDRFSSVDFPKTGGYLKHSSGKEFPSQKDKFFIKFTGYIWIPEPGEYNFYVSSDDGFRLKIGNEAGSGGTAIEYKLVTEYQKTRGYGESSGSRYFSSAGMYPIELCYYEWDGSSGIRLDWARPNAAKELLSSKYLRRDIIDVGDTGEHNDAPSLDVGYRRTTGSSYFQGGIDDLWIFNDAKTQSEIRKIMNKPVLVFTNTTGANGKVNVVADLTAEVAFTVDTPAGINRYFWVKKSGSEIPTDNEFRETSSNMRKFGFGDPGDHVVYCKAIGSNGMESDIIAIPVYAWNRPVVKGTPSQSAMDKGVSWYKDKYVGVVGEPVNLMAEADLNGNEAIARYIWDLDGNWDTREDQIEQVEGGIVQHTWESSSLSSRILCKAITNYDIESAERMFDLKIYSIVEVDPDGPYTGVPNETIQLKGSINKGSYPGYQNIEYQWHVYDGTAWVEDVPTDSNGNAEYAWAPTGNDSDTYSVRHTATVETAEAFTLTGSATTSVTIEGGRPTAMPGGPYRGGITGGNFSSIQFEGNHPDFVETADVGRIADWQWFFGDPKSRQSGLVGEFYEYPSGLSDLDSIESYIRDNQVTPEAVRVFETVDFPSTGGDFAHSNVALEPVGLSDLFFARFTGFVDIWKPGNYVFHVTSDDGFRLRIGDQTIVESLDAAADVYEDTTFEEAGIYPIELTYFEATGSAYLTLYWQQPEEPRDPASGLIAPISIGPVTRLNSGGLATGIWNPTHTFAQAGTHTVRLRVQSEFGKWSTAVTTKVEVIDGKISGYVRAADLRTAVREVTLTLSSSHVDPEALAQIAASDESLNTVGDDRISTETDENGYYAFEHIPLGSYRITASKVNGGDVHEFETPVVATELTLDAPNQIAIDFVDISVFPVGGRIVYSIQKQGQDVLVEDAIVKALPIGTTSYIESLMTTKSLSADGTNYSLPLFAGKYLMKADMGGHNIRIKETFPGYDRDTGLVTIKNAVTDLDFIDYATRELTVYVEDSGEFPIDVYREMFIQVEVNGNNGYALSDNEDKLPDNDLISDEGSVYFKAIVPPGKYTVGLANVPSAVVKGETSKKQAEVDLTVPEPQSVTMVVPVPIELEIGPTPRLFDPAPEEFLDEIGLTEQDNPEGYMLYFPPDIQEHTYTIKATANGNPVRDFSLKVRDDVSQLTADPADEIVYQAPETDEEGNGLYTMSAGLPNMTIVVKDDPDTYLEYTLSDGTTVVKVPKVLPKEITFRASKDGYEDSDIYTEEVTVLGDVTLGSEAELVSIPNINYLVLHDPPGDGSHAYMDDSLMVKGVIPQMKIRAKYGEIPVYPSPWSVERTISGVNYQEVEGSDQDLGKKGVHGYDQPDSVVLPYMLSATGESISGLGVLLPGPIGLAAQVMRSVVATAILVGGESFGLVVQYEASSNRHLETNSSDNIPDLMGPGKGDLYYGEGWTLALQIKYRLGIKKDQDDNWVPDTAQILTYNIMRDVSNQYVYMPGDIENIIAGLGEQIAAIGDPGGDKEKEEEKQRLEDGKDTWRSLLESNPAYVWQRDYVRQEGQEANRENLEGFIAGNFGEDWRANSELLMFSGGGTTFDYSREIAVTSFRQWTMEVGVETSSELHHTFDVGPSEDVDPPAGPSPKLEISWGVGSSVGIKTGQSYSGTWESGDGMEQTVGFALSDDDVDDKISTYVLEGPWGTPIFFTDPGSVTSSPWDPGTNKAVDLKVTLVEQPTRVGPFDYHDGAHYIVQVDYTGQRNLETATVDFVIYAYPDLNPNDMTSRFNGDQGDFGLYFDKKAPSIPVEVSLYPPAIDLDNSEEKQYSVGIEVDFIEDPSQINQVLTLTPTFADLRAPRATITAPYEGQRISPAVFTGDKKFGIEAFCDDQDVSKIQLEIRSKQTDGVWEPWRLLSGMVWEEGVPNDAITLVTHTDSYPIRNEFTFDWIGDEIATLGVGEYALRAVAQDKATRLKEDSSQEAKPNVDLDAPVVTFKVDGSMPTVLTTMPDYQATERERIYRGELSATFNDDMRMDDFTDRTFYVTDLLNNGEKVAGFVSYSPALRKAVFVPIVPFQPNGFFRAEIKTDAEKPDRTIEKGVHDLAGNPLDNAFTWTFRTTDSPFEEIWSIILSAVDGVSSDGNNIAAVEYGAEDAEDEKDARAVPKISSQFELSFLDRDQVKFDRDVRPADGRLGHHWFFAISNPEGDVTIMYQPSVKLAKGPNLRQYKVIRLVEFDANGNVTNMISLKPEDAEFDPTTGQYKPFEAYFYTPEKGEVVRHFRLDVQKAGFVATEFIKGTSGWKFLSVPITPERADPFVNFGDDIEPFKLYKYDTAISGYKIYPLDIGEVALQAGHGYFTRLEEDAEVDVGGSANSEAVEIKLADAGWYAIGTPFVMPVNVADLQINGDGFDAAAKAGLIEKTLYSWKVSPDTKNISDAYEAVDNKGQLLPWEGYWLKTNCPDLTLTVPAPAALANYVAPLPPSYDPPMAPPAGGYLHGFDLRFALTSDFSADLITALGTKPNARAGVGPEDQSEPPTLDGTVSAYFDHKDWGTEPGLYNTDYQPPLEVGESRTWELVVYTNEPRAKMRLSWEDTIGQVPDDTMLTFRQIDAANSESSESDWQDMRKVRSVELDTGKFITKVPFEIRAERFTMTQPRDLSVIAGEKEVTISWATDANPFITGYTILRSGGDADSALATCGKLSSNVSQFVDEDVEEEATYTYQIIVHFLTGAELRSEFLTVTTLPVIKETVLLQSYPNPFNPEVWIPYELAEHASVSILIYSSSGQLVRTLDLGVKQRGRYTSKDKAVYWDGKNEVGESVASGVYFYSMKAGEFVAIRKMVVKK